MIWLLLAAALAVGLIVEACWCRRRNDRKIEAGGLYHKRERLP